MAWPSKLSHASLTSSAWQAQLSNSTVALFPIDLLGRILLARIGLQTLWGGPVGPGPSAWLYGLARLVPALRAGPIGPGSLGHWAGPMGRATEAGPVGHGQN